MSEKRQTPEWRPNKRRLKIAALSLGLIMLIAQFIGWYFPWHTMPNKTGLTVNLVIVAMQAVPLFYICVTLSRWFIESYLGRK